MSHRHWIIFACLFLVVATLATYGDLRTHHFINFDDNLYVTDNAPVQGGLTLTGLSWAFTTLHGGFWLPLTWLSFMVDSQLFGLHAEGFLLTNLLLHIASALLLFGWLLRTTRAPGPSFLVAALFALHPLHVESVAWVTERKDVLSTFFCLLTMWAYLWYAEHPGLGRYLLILVCFSLGLMAKPMLVTLPFVLLLLDYWPLGRWPQKSPGSAKNSGTPKPDPGVPLGRLIWEKAPLLALVVIFIVLNLYAQREQAATDPIYLTILPLSVRLANALAAYVTYLVKMIYPSGLAVFYPNSRDAFPLWQRLAAGPVLALISLLIIRPTRRRPYLLVGWLWYLGTLVPVIGLVAGEQALADRFTYVPSIGLFIMAAYGMAELAARWRLSRFLLPVGAGVVLSAFMICTWVQVRYWRDSISLFEHTLKVTRGNPLIQYDLGFTLAAQGKLDQAMAHYAEALRLEPDFAGAHHNLGLALAAQGKIDQALAHYAEALRLNPEFALAHHNLGAALAAQGKLDQAMAQYSEALRLKPDFAQAHRSLGVALTMQGKLDQAVAQFAEALRLKPDAEAHNNLGVALAHQGKIDEAIVMFQKAIQMKPDLAGAYANLGVVLAKQGRIGEAIIICQEALKINPNNSSVQKILSILKAKSPDNR